ncbi:pyridine nucleotide-disulfide oxidoreductase [Streptomyces populi]|uniref:Pyridine nucleotide-disulfide oxidoreductase n=1 Tax=Streptomyces populi TaxID=2058924 RepID=A0A2I0SID0_9ACTN|nr:FAD-dependent monooxygenase [Streptomyces populi]PKT69683.1 pyridine nucleotide-disulfide oxidoreductase [Streptomyces populi]
MPERSSGRRPAALVIGGGMTGMLAAAVLSDHADVTVVESDVLPRLPAPRKGLPQARHAHLLWSGGVRALENLLPGITDRLVTRGARRVPIMSGMVSKAPSGQWFRRFDDARHLNLVCSRDLLDSTIRTEVLRLPRVTLRERTELIALEGDADRVTGVRVRGSVGDGVLSAALVIDATGRASRAPVWLTDLGLPPVEERVVDAGVGYASRFYRAPASTGEDFPIVNVQADPRRPPGRGGIILPVEEGRWLVTLSGTRGGRPSRDNGEFVPFARSLAHPVIGDLLAGAEPISDVVTTHSTANKRRYFEKSPRWPAGFAVLGDAVAGYNPVYGHGLTAAAQSVLALKRVLAGHALDSPETARHIQRRAARPVGQAWDLAVGQDVLYPGATDETPGRLERVAAGFIDRAVDAGARNPHALRVLLDVMSMERPPARLLAPDMLFRVFLGRKEPLLDGPPLTEAERKAAGL